MDAALGDFLDRLSVAETEADAGGLLLSLFQNMGADGGNIWFACGDDKDETCIASSTTYSAGVIERMYELGYDLVCTNTVSKRLRPMRWGWDIIQNRFEKGSPDYEFSGFAHGEVGLANSLIIPIDTPGKRGSSGASFYQNAPQEQFDRFVEERSERLALAAYAAHTRMQSLRARELRGVLLSARERECLLWLARGLRTKEIGSKLNLREVTVHLHITNARRKLSSATREQAIARAIMHGLINP